MRRRLTGGLVGLVMPILVSHAVFADGAATVAVETEAVATDAGGGAGQAASAEVDTPADDTALSPGDSTTTTGPPLVDGNTAAPSGDEVPTIDDPTATTTTTTTVVGDDVTPVDEGATATPSSDEVTQDDDSTTSTTSTAPPAGDATTTTTPSADDATTTATTAATSSADDAAATATPTTTTPTTPPADATTTTTVPIGGHVATAGGAVMDELRPITFPVAGPVRYGDDFGNCRDGCRRRHQGVDVVGDRLQPILAMRDGVVDRLLDHPTAGYGIVIEDSEGWEYHAYHVNNDTPWSDDGADPGSWRFAPGVVRGATVTAGQLIGWMGDSGNSEGSVPHAHVEIHRPDGSAMNPYWSLRLAQRDVNCALQDGSAPSVSEPVAATPSTEPDADSFLEEEWSSPALINRLPGAWLPLPITGGRPGTGDTLARMWVGPLGVTPVDAGALRAGDARYEDDCAQPPVPTTVPAELGAILATIRTMETGGNYSTQISSSTASGAYAFLDSTWGGYGGYRRARDAPPRVQDAKAVELATYILRRNGGDVSTVPVSWYIGHVPVGAEWETVPSVGANILTPRQYQSRWMATYARMVARPDAFATPAAAWSPVDVLASCRIVVVDVGSSDEPAYVLTAANIFAADVNGRAVPAPSDPCDPRGDVSEPEPVDDPPTGSMGPR